MVNKALARRRPRRRDPDATRDALVAAGTALFAERGYDGASVAAIAAGARVNKAMISYHFGGKRGLYRAIVRGTFSEIVARAEALADASRPAPDLLRGLVALIAETAAARHAHFPAMMLREVLTGGRRLDAEIIAYPLRVAEVVRRIVDRGVREGSFRPVDPLLTHLTLVGSVLFFFATAPVRARAAAEGRLPAGTPDTAAYVKHIQDLVLHGLAAPARHGPTNGEVARGRAR
jgi:TetR/AcrR family transcriptional regulator